MKMDMNSLPDDARIWIYQSNRELITDEVAQIQELLTRFTGGWKAHGQPLQAASSILYNRFIVLSVNEETAPASGCSIDDSVRVMKEIGEKYGLDLFNRMLVCYMNGQSVVCDPIHDFWAKRKGGVVTDETLVFDTTVQTLGALKHNFLVTFKKSWHSEMW
ncbi:MAG: ABC transporter ATPase [Cryomorphaceae bacterium]|nr:ABC transporter ATPase [Cryomorphaceae bacterium]